MKTIDTLVDDIYNLFDDNTDWTPSEENINTFAHMLAKKIAARASQGPKEKGTLRMSNLGTPCDRKLYYHVNDHENAEPLTPETKIKFLYGDILEELLLFLAAEAGHRVEGEQDEVTLNGIVGHRDAIIDGRLVDVKSASSLSFNKFKNNELKEKDKDPFGYITQLETYYQSSKDEPIVTDKGVASFLVIDKTLGKICLDTYAISDTDYEKVAEEKKAMVASDTIPRRGFSPVPEGKSGNMKLDTNCRYCDHKFTCWPGLRTFIYSSGPMYLTLVNRPPKVVEVDRKGEVVSDRNF